MITITGKITDASSGSGIPDANIKIGRTSATSDSTGNYSMSIPDGNYTIRVFKNEYSMYVAFEELVSDRVIDIQLHK